MYLVRWNDHEGNERQRPLRTLEDARLEAKALEEEYGWAEIRDANGNTIEA